MKWAAGSVHRRTMEPNLLLSSPQLRGEMPRQVPHVGLNGSLRGLISEPNWLPIAIRLLAVGLIGLSLLCCKSESAPIQPLCSSTRTRDCTPPDQAEKLLVAPDVQIVGAERTKTGGAGAWILTLRSTLAGRRMDYRVKWRPLDSASSINSPRKEVIAHFLQRLFLDPEDYVFPPTRTRCFELSHYRAQVDSGARATFEEAPGCALGVVSFWLEGARSLDDDHFADEANARRWNADSTYRATLADANLLSYLSLNGDTHTGNWLLSGDENSERIYLVDNSISLGRIGNFSIDPYRDYSNLLVPALRRKSLARVLALKDDDLESLLLVEKLVPRDGLLFSQIAGDIEENQTQVESRGQRFSKCAGTNCRKELLIGITRHELYLVRSQIWHLRSRWMMGEIDELDSKGNVASP